MVAELEAQVAELLGKPAAVFLPSGTMAQAATLRVHADARGTAHGRLAPVLPPRAARGPGARPAAPARRPPGRAPRAPRRARRPHRRRRAARRAAARAAPAGPRGPAARLGRPGRAESAGRGSAGPPCTSTGRGCGRPRAGYDRAPAEIAGAVRHRLRLVLQGHRRAARLLRSPVRLTSSRRSASGADASAARCSGSGPARPRRWPGCDERARGDAGPPRARPGDRRRRCGRCPGSRVVPDPPQTPMLHLLLPVGAETFAERARATGRDRRRVGLAERLPHRRPGVVRVELTVGRATCGWTPEEVREVVRRLVEG